MQVREVRDAASAAHHLRCGALARRAEEARAMADHITDTTAWRSARTRDTWLKRNRRFPERFLRSPATHTGN
jgi:hypothetical protein